MEKKTVVLLVILVSLTGCKRHQIEKSNSDQAEMQKKIDARVILQIAGQSYCNKDLNDFIQQQYIDDIKSKKDDPALLSVLFRQFIDQKLILFAAAKEKIEVSDDEVAESQKKTGVNQADMQSNLNLMREMVLIQKFLAIKIYKGIEVSDAEVDKYYQQHMTDFNKPEEIFLFGILLDSGEKAIKIRSELVNAPDRFEEIARQESKSVEAASGGSMGFFEKGQLPKEIEDVVFSLKKNQISPVVKSEYGSHIFKVTQKRSAKQLSLFLVKDEIRNKLLSEKTGAAYQDYLQQLKKDTAIQIFKENLYFVYQEGDGDAT